MNEIRIAEFADVYLDELDRLLRSIDRSVYTRIVEQLERTRAEDATVYVIGNGGSASVASHMSNDLSIGARHEGVKPLKVISLTDNVSSITALGNDMGFDSIFVEQLRPVLKPGDLLIAFSVSGNSPNVIKAVEFAKEMGVVTVGCTGFDGGRLRQICDISFHAGNEKGYYGPPEDAFMVLDHLIYTYYKFKHFGK